MRNELIMRFDASTRIVGFQPSPKLAAHRSNVNTTLIFADKVHFATMCRLDHKGIWKFGNVYVFDSFPWASAKRYQDRFQTLICYVLPNLIFICQLRRYRAISVELHPGDFISESMRIIQIEVPMEPNPCIQLLGELYSKYLCRDIENTSV